jgi:iron complex outermembrane receptor protein
LSRAASLLVAALAAGAIPAAAQEPPDTVARLAPVVVRVLRGAVGAGSPYAVAVATRAQLTRGHAGAYLEEALRAVPGVQVQNRFNLASGERLAVRGFGSRAQFGIRGLRVLVDGVPATLPDGQTALDHVDVAALERVEILRGPGSALYGNAAGGVLHFESAAPSVAPQGSVRSAGGSHGLRTLAGSVSGRAGTVGARVGISRYAYDGFRRNPVADDGSTYGRQERTLLNAVVDARLASGRIRLVANGLDMGAANAGSLSRALLDGGEREAFRSAVTQRTREDVRQGQVGATWKGPVRGLDGEVAAWGIRRDFEGRIPSDVVAFDRAAAGLRALFSGSRTMAWARVALGAGVEVELQRDDRRNWANALGERGALRLDQLERVLGTALFGQARIEPSPRLSLVGGMRWDAFRFRAEDRFLSDGADDTGERVLSALSPSLGMVWEAAPRVELFASVATAFETPTTTELANRPEGAGGFNPGLEPTRALTAEGGLRARAVDGWSLEATLFRTGLRDELVPFEVTSSPGRTFYRNAGESSHRGWEMTVEGRPAPQARARVAYTHVDARFRRYVTSEGDFGGNRIPGLAPHRVDAVAAVERGAAFLELRGLWQDAIPVDDAGTAASPASLVVDARAGLQGATIGRLRVEPFFAVANVFDRTYNASVVVNAFGGRFFEPGPGRTVQAGASVTFGGS